MKRSLFSAFVEKKLQFCQNTSVVFAVVFMFYTQGDLLMGCCCCCCCCCCCPCIMPTDRSVGYRLCAAD